MQTRSTARLLLVFNTVLLRQQPAVGFFFGMGEAMSRPSTMPTPEEALPGIVTLQKLAVKYHYENMSMQYTVIFEVVKNENFQ